MGREKEKEAAFRRVKELFEQVRPKGATSFCEATKMKQKVLFRRRVTLFAMAKSQ